jgi:hypothetical protein
MVNKELEIMVNDKLLIFFTATSHLLRGHLFRKSLTTISNSLFLIAFSHIIIHSIF